MEEIERLQPEPTREVPALHRCRCLIPPYDRCPAMVSLDQPVCNDCEHDHFGENRVRDGHLVPLGQP